MKQRNKYLQMRITPKELVDIKKKAEKFGSMSYYIRSSLLEFSNVNDKEKMGYDA